MLDSNNLANYRLNHYVILDGTVAQDALQVLNQWLSEMGAKSLTERAWVYSAGAGAEESMGRSRDILERLRTLSPRESWQPFRILFLEPRGTGSFSYLMSPISDTDDELGAAFVITDDVTK